jgi:hypothetical protein
MASESGLKMRLELLLHALVIMFIVEGLSESEGFAHLPQNNNPVG